MPGRVASGYHVKIRQIQHTPLHLVLQLILELAVNVREEHGLLVGNLATAMEQMFLEHFILYGEVAPLLREPNVSQRMKLLRQGQKPAAGAVIRVALVDSKISRVSIELKQFHDFEQAGSIKHVYVTDVLEIGTTKLDVPHDLRVVFSDVLAGAPIRRARH